MPCTTMGIAPAILRLCVESESGFMTGQVGCDDSVQNPRLLRRLLRAKDRIDAESHESWPIVRLAQVSGVSAAHFARSFKHAFSVPPHRYLLARRIERATALLRDTNLPITEIALRVGWESLGTFGRTFRDITGNSPREYRQAAQARANGGSMCIPACFLKASNRPNLKSAVLEKSRSKPLGHNEAVSR